MNPEASIIFKQRFDKIKFEIYKLHNQGVILICEGHIIYDLLEMDNKLKCD